ncbi:hypothetical protein [Synechococcus elongatus]|uniref:Uncharacterized protein n=2 Tax=Synechococcus elongatus TaxID=32046 RepID=Q31QB5_SYNE7|nr:hypothetical protein [Synechococcus elongatus]ABB56754.1 conserved hypothetical protein [Synechococcus elongatus PCC 7942 = FACHB-805]AJD58706.1 hypothetical protein M744_13145 [Synechococcus elongatus UTEX 2973]MBD2588616.1 hypothetical protein [Synechococcus elongatus FACHB-242]MBD2689795.1 hypothetical protein [Synechococcus elongatus FACHB-1061]MBD2708402.1 hypothetical protein [Synechococcus elongatus PCC 7942 = FACHB-805]
MSSELARTEQPAPLGVFSGAESFALAQRMAQALAASSLVPEAYRGDVSNTLIALEVSQRIGASPLMVMQNLHIIEGRPAWSSQFVIAALNSCGRFTPLRFRVEDRGEQTVTYDYWTGKKGERQKHTASMKVHDRTCIASATDKATGEVIEGPEVSIAMAVAEGWYTKSGSKWQTMPELMLRYRAAKFFGSLYAPDMLMGLQTADEVRDIERVEVKDLSVSRSTAIASSQSAIAKDELEKAYEVVEAELDRLADQTFAEVVEPEVVEPAPVPRPVAKRQTVGSSPELREKYEKALEAAGVDEVGRQTLEAIAKVKSSDDLSEKQVASIIEKLEPEKISALNSGVNPKTGEILVQLTPEASA